MKTIVKNALIALLLFGVSGELCAQTIRVSGYVADSRTGETLIGAGVQSEKAGTVTNNYGFFSIPLTAGKDGAISFSYVGYETQRMVIKAKRDTLFTVFLNPDASIKESVVTAERNPSTGAALMEVMDIPVEILKTTPFVLGEPDVLKTVQMMPGVQFGNEGFTGLFIRGGGSDECLYLMDGVPMYNVSHALGLFSAFTPEAVKKVTLYKGGFPARFGGRTSGVLDVRMNDGNVHEHHGSFSVGMLTERVHLEGPIIEKKLSYSLSLRGLHTIILTPVIKLAGGNMNYYYYDVNGKLTWTPTERDKIFLSLYTGKDYLDYRGIMEMTKEKTEEKVNLGWGNTVGALRWSRVISSKVFSEIQASYNRYDMNSAYKHWSLTNNQSYEAETGSLIGDFNVSGDFDFHISDRHLLKAGAMMTLHQFAPRTSFYVKEEVEGGEEKHADVFNKIPGKEASLYFEDEFSVSDRLKLDYGIRGTWMNSEENYYSIEPRVSVWADIFESLSAKLSYTRMSQYVHLLTSSLLAMPTDLWVPITKDIPPIISDQIGAGVLYNGIKGWEFSVESFYKKSSNVIDYKDGASYFATTRGWEDIVSVGNARSKGAEFYAHKKEGKLTGWLSYTLSRSDRQYPDGSINNGNWFPYKYDRRHNFVIATTYKVSPKCDLSATWSYTSGVVTTAPEGVYEVMIGDEGNIRNSIIPYTSSRNNYRLPGSHRLNISANFSRQFKKGSRVLTVGVYNLYNAMNPNIVFVFDNREIDAPQSERGKVDFLLKKLTFLPILPSISYTYSF